VSPNNIKLNLYKPVVEEVKKIDLTIYDDEINSNKETLVLAAETKNVESTKVIESLLNLEKLMRSKNKLDEGATSIETLQNLNGSWRLIFTTGYFIYFLII
jgi:hypothetical protein